MSAGEANNDGGVSGRLLGGRYRVTSTIGRGGMGVVAKAVDELLDREVAVKILRAYTDVSAPELADLRARMRREAQAAARIRHSGVVTVHDVTEQDGLPVIVMELVDGPSLDDVLAERGALDPREAAAIGAQVMDALDAAHRAGVLHRDVKPGNILLERGGRVVLTDFGIATMEATGDEAMAKLTRSGELVGSLDFLPPERAQGREPGPASDIWSLGMALYAAVEGTPPFRRTSVWSTLSAIVTDPLPPARRAGALTPVLEAFMAKEPEHRPTADEARRMLERVAASGREGSFGPPPPATPVPVATPVAGSVPAPVPGGTAYPQQAQAGHDVPSVPPGTVPAGLRTANRRRRSRRTAVVAAAAAVVLAGGGITYALATGHDAEGAGTPTGSGALASPGSASSTPVAGDDANQADLPLGEDITPGATASAASPATPSASGSHRPGSTAKPSTPPGSSAKPSASKPASGAASGKPGSVSTSCDGWSHRDPAPGSYAYMAGDYHLETGPYQVCPAVSAVKSGTKLWYHCYVSNAYGNRWIYVRLSGSNTMGWMSADNITRQSGPSTPC
ncbi:serine/threonine-protein kinase [Streptomyces sp. NBC_00083]|uniref:serine/threonine-protein kinase n=1 Tax=Streptomyces sp. NBC_00083 TaxID=2975647 RepID=UPI00225828AD|nr:serine/threonine-protein kinase [Streptomyces sp. NBC_00083]MCX5387099.1 protein kinase [Streptomyces sp. NBC_00083]